MVFGGGMFRPSNTAQKVKFLLKNFCSKCDQIHSFLRIWSHLLEKSLMETLFLVQCKFFNWIVT